MSTLRVFRLIFLFFIAAIFACSPRCALAEKKQEATGQAPPVPEVTVITAVPRDTPVTIEFVGKTVSSRRVEIRSRVEGFLEKRLYTEGSMVKEGDVLFQMDQKPFQADLRAAKAELAQQQARLENAEANLKRVKPLAEKNAVSQKDLDDAIGTYRSSAAAVEAAKAKVVQAELSLSYTTITSPVTGLSSFAVKQEGAYIGFGSDSLLTYVAQLNPMWVEFSVSENQILKSRRQSELGIIKHPEQGDMEVEVVLADGSIFPNRGRITFADAALSEETGTFLLRAELENVTDTDNELEILRPGQFVRARLHGMVRPNAILVPQRAVQQGAKGSFVWVIDEEGKAEFQPVTVGQWHGDDWFIDAGLEGGETVVVDGALKLRPGTPVKIVEPGEVKTENN
ncbi:MAG: hemolysin D [Desulfobacterales bacterium SG8_35]|nr:MAG: hemolysin D [Desulfobacterales bacterium SG8_35]